MSHSLSLGDTLTPSDRIVPGAAGVRVAQLSSALRQAQSERRHAEDENAELAAQLQALMDALPAAVLVLDGEGRVQQSNPAAETLLAVPLQGELWRDLIRRLFVSTPTAQDALTLHNDRLVTLSTRPLGSQPGQVLLLQDVTEKRRLQAHLEHQRRLADMGRMAASLAHQIRTPLSSALLYVSQLKGERLTPAQRERFVGRAMQSLKGLEKLITDMLLFVNGDSGRLEPLRPAALLYELQQEMEPELQKKGIEMSIDAPIAESVRIAANRTLLKSALQNLLVNASQAVAGGGAIKLAACLQGESVELVVADNGPGIAARDQARIFEPFVSGRSGGTGLGLAVVRAVARAHGGEVVLTSAPGEGSRFAIRLPLSANGRQRRPEVKMQE
jgi:two-component system sensor histidine kinase FlrB